MTKHKENVELIIRPIIVVNNTKPANIILPIQIISEYDCDIPSYTFETGKFYSRI